MRRTIAGLLLLATAGCADAPTSGRFEYKATAGWYVGTTPNVTSMTIDGQPYASGEMYALDEFYKTYEEALASFVARDVVITTTTETLNFKLDIGACKNITLNNFDMPVTKETAEFYAWNAFNPPPTIEFYAECGMCESKDKISGFCARTQ